MRYSQLSLVIAAGLLSAVTACRVSVNDSDTVKAIASTPEEQAQVIETTKEFLNEVDKEAGDTWSRLAPSLTTATPQKTWVATLAAMKAACGPRMAEGRT